MRQNSRSRFRACYETALRVNPNVGGRVAVKFVIGRDGSVMNAADGGSDLPDQSVISCVVRNFTQLSFPKPDDGVATVIYPLLFTPAEQASRARPEIARKTMAVPARRTRLEYD